MRNAVILAAGRGTRMGELTRLLPKPMLPLGGKPLLEHILDRLREAAFERFLIVTGYHAGLIESHFAAYPAEIEFRRQQTMDGTGSAALLARDFAGQEPFLLTFGDILTEARDYSGMRDRMEDSVDGVIAVRWVEDPWQGAAVYETDGCAVRIVEKPPPGTSSTHWNSAGVFCFRHDVFDVLAQLERSPRGEFELTSAQEKMIAAGRRLVLHPLRGAWRDVGRPEDIAAAEEML